MTPTSFPCPFCRIARRETPAHIIYEDEYLVAFLDTGPIRPGHVQIIPRDHYPAFDELTAELASRIIILGQRLARILKSNYEVTRAAFLFTGGDIAHAHAHVVPMVAPTDITSRRYIAEEAITFQPIARPSEDELGRVAFHFARRAERTGAMKIRRAVAGDAEPASLVLRRSITELCTLDHENDLAMLAKWLVNKTPEKFTDWAAAADQLCLVAAGDDGTILGVALLSKMGEIKLNYVSPDARFQGVSAALIEALEAEARSLGIDRVTLNSTATAHRFYQARGYKDEVTPETGRLKDSIYPMTKTLGGSTTRK